MGPTSQLTLADPVFRSSLNQFLEPARAALIRARAGQTGMPTAALPVVCLSSVLPSHSTHTQAGRDATPISNAEVEHLIPFPRKLLFLSEDHLVCFMTADKEKVLLWWPLSVKVISSRNLLKQTLSEHCFPCWIQKRSFLQMSDDDSANAEWMCRDRFWYVDRYFISNYLNSSESNYFSIPHGSRKRLLMRCSSQTPPSAKGSL